MIGCGVDWTGSDSGAIGGEGRVFFVKNGIFIGSFLSFCFFDVELISRCDRLCFLWSYWGAVSECWTANGRGNRQVEFRE